MTADDPAGSLVVDAVGAHYRIDGVERMDPFLTTVVSDTDLWMFVSSTGAVTAGRRNADHSVFPYQTDDRLHRAAGRVGPVTTIARSVDGRRELWRPFGPELHESGQRSLSKHVSGHRLVFEEVHREWNLRWRATWEPSDRFGWVRTSELINDGGTDATVEVLDGVVDVMPDGVDAFFEQIRSNLVDAYKRSEVGPWGPLAIFNLETLITDRAEPIEALSATTVWSTGAEWAEICLDDGAVAAMAAGRRSPVSSIVRGRPGSYLLRGDLEVAPGGATRWALAIDIGRGHAEIAALADEVRSGAAADAVDSDVARGAARLDELLTAVDGDQASGDPVADAHHRSNALFNSMRGGVFVDGPCVPIDDFVEFARVRNSSVAVDHIARAGTHDSSHVSDLIDDALAVGDPDVVRLALEYLPLTFSRRHGDPSRPWNRFDIDVRTLDGEQRLAYEGNWRDIFQNWEALLQSVPAFLPNVVAKFVNATSAEGYNAYRITREGLEWEKPDPADPWAHLGYWGDHQLIYLLRLLEAWRRFSPTGMNEWLDRPVFSYADIPYRLADHAEMITDPRNTIVYDEDHAGRIAEREERIGTDGRLLVDQADSLIRVGLVEKLLIPSLAKIACFVPGAGVWLNTQRPEWNDANNALAGTGASIVTLFHLRRYLAVLVDIVESSPERQLTFSAPAARWCEETAEILEREPVDADDRTRARSFIDGVGTAATEHRRRVRNRTSFEPVAVESTSVVAMCRRAIEHVDATLDRSQRTDGLLHSYNLVSFPADDAIEVDHLTIMLEGHVAALASGVLTPSEAADLVDAVLTSDLHRADLDTLLLYPAVELPAFLDRNVITDDQVARLATTGVDPSRLGSTFSPDPAGCFRFRSHVTNVEQLSETLADESLTNAQRSAVLNVFEDVFDHRSFTGRSARMYGYEGLGSVYWHMVAKLLLAIQETVWTAVDDAESVDTVARLAAQYRRVRDGFGFRMTPELFGAFPTDCYSHNPAHSGAQQPGMTGQVKEEILTRFGELGIRVVGGRVRLTPLLLPVDEVLCDGTAEFSFCGVPMTIDRSDSDHVVVHSATGSSSIDELELSSEVSAELFARRGDVTAIAWHLGPETIARWKMFSRS